MNTSTSASPQPSALGSGPPKFTIDTGLATVLIFFALVAVGGFLISQAGDEEEGLEANSNSRDIRDSIEMKDMGESTLNEGSSSNVLTP
ncbi:hypothetical protein TWF173_004464 [Orbilia oligospora]|nr:hypothetical protein TWF173_004464 [Orbilia oligospora]